MRHQSSAFSLNVDQGCSETNFLTWSQPNVFSSVFSPFCPFLFLSHTLLLSHHILLVNWVHSASILSFGHFFYTGVPASHLVVLGVGLSGYRKWMDVLMHIFGCGLYEEHLRANIMQRISLCHGSCFYEALAFTAYVELYWSVHTFLFLFC